MEPHDPAGPRTLPLEPQGPERSSQRFDHLAQAGGTLVGAVVEDAFRTWLLGSGGHVTLVVWPSGFTARFDDLHFDLLDERGDIVAKGRELITIGGGFLAKISSAVLAGARDDDVAGQYAGQVLARVRHKDATVHVDEQASAERRDGDDFSVIGTIAVVAGLPASWGVFSGLKRDHARENPRQR